MSTLAAPSLLPLGAITQGDIRFNIKRVAPYALMIVFTGNALLWWGAGPAPSRGWATNSDVFITSMFTVFSFMTLPFFTALLMGDPVLRDFEIGIDPLVFSKPIKRLEYLLGKFLGNFAVLVACEACFALTLLLLQATPLHGMLTVSPRVLPFVKHFLVLVVLSSLPLAMLSFVVGTLTRSVKVVYAMTTACYVLYAAWQTTVLRTLSPTWRVVLDPLLMNWTDGRKGMPSPLINDVEFGYGADVAINRVLVLVASTLLFAVLYARFSPGTRSVGSATSAQLFRGPRRAPARRRTHGEHLTASVEPFPQSATVPLTAARGHAARVRAPHPMPWIAQLGALLDVELRALRAERSIAVLLPLAIVFCLVDAAYLGRVASATSALYAATVATPLLLAFTGITIVYLGESMARERVLRVEPLVWATPVSNAVLVLSKLIAAALLSLAITGLVIGGALALQIAHGHAPVELRPFALAFGVILLPTLLFVVAAVCAVNVAVRDKHAAYAAGLAIAGGLYWLLAHGYDHPLYNVPLVGRWTARDLTGAPTERTFLLQRGYVMALAGVLASGALAAFERRPTGRGIRVLREPGAIAALLVAMALAVGLGVVLVRAS